MKRKSRRAAPDLFSPRCSECGEYLITTESGYLACPRGHGKLFIEAIQRREGFWPKQGHGRLVQAAPEADCASGE